MDERANSLNYGIWSSLLCNKKSVIRANAEKLSSELRHNKRVISANAENDNIFRLHLWHKKNVIKAKDKFFVFKRERKINHFNVRE